MHATFVAMVHAARTTFSSMIFMLVILTMQLFGFVVVAVDPGKPLTTATLRQTSTILFLVTFDVDVCV